MAAGSNKLVLEVTCGKGAFMKDIERAKELSKIMKEIGTLAGIETVCIITNMNQPIGKNIGNSLEIEEAVKALKGDMQEDVKKVVLELVAYILKLAGKGDNLEVNKQMAMQEIENGKAYEKFLELVKKQGGDIEYLDNIPKAKYVSAVHSEKSGYISDLNAQICRKSLT